MYACIQIGNIIYARKIDIFKWKIYKARKLSMHSFADEANKYRVSLAHAIPACSA